jgi:hypothetical protein
VVTTHYIFVTAHKVSTVLLYFELDIINSQRTMYL